MQPAPLARTRARPATGDAADADPAPKPVLAAPHAFNTARRRRHSWAAPPSFPAPLRCPISAGLKTLRRILPPPGALAGHTDEAAYAYLVADDGGPEACFRASPPRASGSRATVRWAIDGLGRPTALHTLRRPLDDFAADSLERRAMHTLGADCAPRAAFVDEQGRRTLALPLYDADLFYLIDCVGWTQHRKLIGRKLLRDVADCVAKLHAEALVHNDIKPENIYWRYDGHFTLGDFDQVFVDHDAAPVHQRVVLAGSPSYPAPEFFFAELPLGRAVDVFRLGMSMLCFYDGQLYDQFCGNVRDRRAKERVRAPWSQRPRATILLLKELQQARSTGQDPSRTGWTPELHHRYYALCDLRRQVERCDPAMEMLLFDHLLRIQPKERMSAAALAGAAEALMPRAGRKERYAVDALQQIPHRPQAVRQQRHDLIQLLRLPAAPPSPPRCADDVSSIRPPVAWTRSWREAVLSAVIARLGLREPLKNLAGQSDRNAADDRTILGPFAPPSKVDGSR